MLRKSVSALLFASIIAAVSTKKGKNEMAWKNFLKNMFYGLAAAVLITMMFLVLFFVLLFLPVRYNNPLVAGVLSTIITGIIVIGILKEQEKG